jgi:hypothetical protein
MLLMGVLSHVRIAQAEIVAHWKFDEASGIVASPSVGSWPGYLQGGSRFAPNEGKSGGAVQLDRETNSLVNMGAILPMTNTAQFSIQAWVKTNPGDATELWVAGRHQSGYWNGYELFVNGINSLEYREGKAGFYDSASNFAGRPPGVFFSQTPVNDGAWHQLVGVYERASTARLYVDGQFEAFAEAWDIGDNSATSFLIGGLTYGNDPTGAFTGYVDDVQVYNTALTASSVKYLFDNPGQVIVPEPSTGVPLLISFAGLAGLRRREGWHRPSQ